ncbi:uncharacterized protein Z519_03689 [Cladophialophora bantiana CBS 173.52]|uniref:GST N-terminal domain-containing protein n=1 Tax=Cladophialophora bantiana (strain ATCC 10958 / CBS 173.52 / CDC B-1940 / NIH 8579) TaxID=1442370 RepID=A0A0D2HVX8_CLAB1|nr:uncharacterized protein Z519_03689 [Cladophialophora bantiana CBS 173.52]KIW95105.1 hypothetical protein Z519_03689 [Cladophialophora bantiana CBS 173.52]
MSQPIILYDLPTRAPRRCWSLNPWKNEKCPQNALPLENKLNKFPSSNAAELQTTELSDSSAPNAAGIPYTVPTIQMSDGEWVMDSRKIAERLEQLYPEPPLNIAADPYLVDIEDLVNRIAKTVSPDFIPKDANRVLGDGSLGYWH